MKVAVHERRRVAPKNFVCRHMDRVAAAVQDQLLEKLLVQLALDTTGEEEREGTDESDPQSQPRSLSSESANESW